MTQDQTNIPHSFTPFSTLIYSLAHLCACALIGCGGSGGSPQQATRTQAPHDALKKIGSAQPITRYASSLIKAREGCEESLGAQGEIKLRYLASRLGSDLRVHEYCRVQEEGEPEGSTESDRLQDSEKPEKIQKISEINAGSCPPSLTCGVAYVHRDAAPEVGVYLALADLAQRLLPIQQSSLKEGYEQEIVGRESAVQTTSVDQSSVFQIKGGGRCVSSLKNFQDEMREEARYVGVETSHKEHSAVLIFQRVFFEERVSLQGKRQISLVLDIEAEGNHEGALLQQSLSCELPNTLTLTQHPQLTFWSRSAQTHERVIEVSGALSSLPSTSQRR